MQSDNAPRRSYDRQVAKVQYSHPISKQVRLRPSLEYRQWDYDSRIARGDPQGDLRQGRYFAPPIEDAVRVGIRVSYRF